MTASLPIPTTWDNIDYDGFTDGEDNDAIPEGYHKETSYTYSENGVEINTEIVLNTQKL